MRERAEEFLCDLLEVVCFLARPTLANAMHGARHWGRPAVSVRDLADLDKRGFIDLKKGARNRKDRVMRLTEKGRLHALGGRDPETCWATPWDGKWRLVLFDIPEREMNLRTNLRRHLLARRFGYLQNSVWVSPHPLGLENALFKGSEINAERLLTLDAVPGTGEKNSDISRAAWDFKSINKNYAEVIKLLEACPGAQVPKSVKGTPPLRRWLVAVRQAWRSAMALDPLLPRALCPPDYLGEKAWKLRSKKLAALALQLEGVLES